MAHFLIVGSYTSEAWAAQIKNPRNRVEAIRPMIEEHGGRIETAYYAFGDYDFFVILEFPDNVSAAAISIAVGSSGAFSSFKTVPLLTMEEGLEAITRAGGADYTTPGN